MFSLFRKWWKANYTYLDPNGVPRRGSTEVTGYKPQHAVGHLIDAFESQGLEITQATVQRGKTTYSWPETG